jgi:hypothetical protein
MVNIQCKAEYRCRDCFFCILHKDTSVRCHIGKPTSSGFPKVDPDAFCGFFTEPTTLKTPYRIDAFDIAFIKH